MTIPPRPAPDLPLPLRPGRSRRGLERRLGSVRTAGVLAGLAAADILLSVVYQWYFLRRVGPGLQTDALYAGMMVPQLLVVVLTGSFMQVLVPLLAVQEKDRFTECVWTFLHLVGFGFAALVLVGWLTAIWWVPLTVPGFSQEGRALTIHLVRIQLPGLITAAVASVLWSAHQARRRFLWSALSSVLAWAAGLTVLILTLPRLGVVAAAWVGVLRSGLYAALLFPGVGRYRLPRWRSDMTAEAWRRMRPLVSRSFYFKADLVVDRFLAGLAPAGALSLLTLARQLYTAGLQVLNRAVTAPAIPALARFAERGAWAEFRRLRNARALTASLLAASGTLLLLLVGRPVLSAFFAHSSFRPDQVVQTWELLLVLSGVWIAGSLSQVLAGAFYAEGDTETPTRIGVVSFTVGIGLKVLGFYVMGVWGIAAGATVHYVLMGVLLLHADPRRGASQPAGAARNQEELPLTSVPDETVNPSSYPG